MFSIVAFTSNLGIGKNGKIPWDLPPDLKRFYKLTKNNTVIMGRKTWDSLSIKPLPNRNNIVLSKTQKFDNDDYKNDIFIIGGSEIYAMYDVQKIYATLILNKYDCDVFYPTKNLDKYVISEYSNLLEYNNIKYRYITYIKKENAFVHPEYNYLNVVKDIMINGSNKCDRTGVGTRSIFGCNMKFDISNCIPLLTTKKVNYDAILKELIWFLQGSTDNSKLVEQGVNIWTPNTSRKFLDDLNLPYEEGDLGPMYGVALRSFGCDYKGCKHNYIGKGYDQLENIVKSIKNDPHSRRHIMTTFNPAETKNCVLAPCHGIAIQFNIDNGKISCAVYNRSQDVFLGVPFNILTYAILTYIIGKKTGYQPDKLIINMGDTHIYKNHFDQVNIQLNRTPLPLPVLVVNDSVINKPFECISINDFDIVGYIHHNFIRAQMAV